MSPRAGSGRRAAALLLPVLLAALVVAPPAGGERSQRGNLIVALRGHLSPLQLDRRRPEPVHLQLGGGLESADGSLLPRVERMEIGFPVKGIVSTRGLPVCKLRQLLNATTEAALAACRPALVGHGTVEAAVHLPDQGAFLVHARLLAFNGPVRNGHRLLLLHAFARQPPTTVVLPFTLEYRRGRFGIVIGADLPAALGPWPHLARFAMNLGRRYGSRRRPRSFLSATCPIPPRFTAGFFSLAKVTYTLVGGRRVSTAITRSCRGM